MSRLRVVPALLPVVLLGLALPGRAAEPSGGEVSASSPTVHWTGGPFLAANPILDTDCIVSQLPFCDTFELTVGELPVALPDVIVSVAAEQSEDLLNLAVYDSSGRKVAEATALGSSQTVVIRAPESGAYSVRTELLLGTPTASTYSGTALAVEADEDVDLTQLCLLDDQTVLLDPDDGRIIDLDVLVLLDGVDESFARSFFDDVARPYADLSIRVVPTFQVASPPFSGDSTIDILNQARSRFPSGKVPPEYDIVEVLTSKDIQALGQKAVAGQADCIGGLAYDERSYEVSESAIAGIPEEGASLGPITFYAHFAAKVTAHEMGHLLGGQHHYSNCVEGIDPDEELSGDTSPCELMFNLGDFVSLNFGKVNGAIVRGYAVRYASANDAT